MVYTHKSLQLEHYLKEKISPVNYDIPNLKKHFQIRGSLYRLLGLIPSFFKGKNVLEVGPGSGQNSIYIASLFPKIYDLLEPNPYACKDISKIFKKFSHKHTKPNLDQIKPELARVLNAVSTGIGVMPAYKGILTDEEIKSVSYYVFKSTNK